MCVNAVTFQSRLNVTKNKLRLALALDGKSKQPNWTNKCGEKTSTLTDKSYIISFPECLSLSKLLWEILLEIFTKIHTVQNKTEPADDVRMQDRKQVRSGFQVPGKSLWDGVKTEPSLEFKCHKRQSLEASTGRNCELQTEKNLIFVKETALSQSKVC